MISIPIGIKTHKQKSARKPAIGVKTRFYVEGGEPGFGRRVFMGFDGLRWALRVVVFFFKWVVAKLPDQKPGFE
jgi:hypothetical protein